jgi:alpha-N-arabinofuranosidase
MACMAPVVNVRGPLFVHPKGFVKRTTFHVLKMYSNPLLPNVVSGKIGTEPMRIGATLDAVATCSDDRRKLAIATVNRHDPMPAQWKLSLCQLNSAKATMTLLSGDSPDAYNGVANPPRVVPETREIALGDAHGSAVETTPHSVAVLSFSA